MKFLSVYMSGLLGLIMFAATILPSIHTLTHNISSGSSDMVFAETTPDCELCDFKFSSPDSPEFAEYELYLPIIEVVYRISLTHTVLSFPNTLFSLRAPPAVIA